MVFLGGVKGWVGISDFMSVQNGYLGKGWVYLCVIWQEIVRFCLFVNFSFSLCNFDSKFLKKYTANFDKTKTN